MSKLITVERAQKEVERLQHYLKLVEEYEVDTLDKWIIKQYAITNSIKRVIEKAHEQYFVEIEREYVVSVIKSKPKDELHKTIKSGYMLKTRPNRRKY
ncbi:hypothetical protein [Pontibacillus sp. HMF3514]|uniref:hypothetical protein n=1 Tax=Pontibacillus sp. HMF3514 TaxID=2692425 RepID=UPI00131FEE0F|nr:hypothetical protein [Pontibacillus sp. HMF3514]QHE52791.1 hypothetical protein GS400_12480 [Pontibacillus sp. HMF3514]